MPRAATKRRRSISKRKRSARSRSSRAEPPIERGAGARVGHPGRPRRRSPRAVVPVAEADGPSSGSQSHPAEDSRRLRSARESAAKCPGWREVPAADRDPVPVTAHVERDDAPAERPHGPDDRRHLVDGVRNDVASGSKPPSNEPIALAGQPVGFTDRPGGADEQILDDEVEATTLALQELEGVPDDDLDSQAVETEVAPGKAQDLPVDLDADDLGVRVEDADRPAHAAGGEPQQEDAPASASGQQQDRGGQRPPDDAGERAARAMDRGLCAVDPKLEALARLPNENSISGLQQMPLLPAKPTCLDRRVSQILSLPRHGPVERRGGLSQVSLRASLWGARRASSDPHDQVRARRTRHQGT